MYNQYQHIRKKTKRLKWAFKRFLKQKKSQKKGAFLREAFCSKYTKKQCVIFFEKRLTGIKKHYMLSIKSRRHIMKTIDPNTIRDFSRYEVRPKLNGIFAEWDGFCMLTKNGNTITSVPHLQPDCPPGTQGELYCHGMPFQQINRIVMQCKDTRRQIEFFPHLDIKPAVVETLAAFFKVYAAALKKGYEGVVLRDRFTGEMFKHKPRQDMESVIVGFNSGTGKNKSTFGSLKLKTEDGELFNCSGMKDMDRRRLWRDQAIGGTVTISYSYLTERGVPVSPAFIDYRLDAPVSAHGGKRPGAGRKPKKKSERRGIKRMYRFTESEYRKILENADNLGMSEAEFVRYIIGSVIKMEDI
jgi:hypothetical protein